MADVIASIHPGACRFTCQVTAASEDERNVRLTIRSECENVQRFAAVLQGEGPQDGGLPEVDAWQEIRMGHEGRIQRAARSSLKGCCAGCMVPGGVFKSMQVAAGLALPVDCSIALARG